MHRARYGKTRGVGPGQVEAYTHRTAVSRPTPTALLCRREVYSYRTAVSRPTPTALLCRREVYSYRTAVSRPTPTVQLCRGLHPGGYFS